MKGLVRILVVAALGGLVSCGGGDDPSSPAKAPAKPTKAQASKAPAKPRKTDRKLRRVKGLLDFAPKDAIAVLHVPDVKRTHDALQKTALAEIWREREVKRTLAAPLEQAAALLHRIPFADALDYDKVLSQLRGELMIAFAAPDRLCAAFDLGDAYLEVHRLVRSYTHTYLALERVDGLDIFTYRPTHARGTTIPVRLCFTQGRLLVGAGEGTLDAMLYGDGGSVLEHPRFAEACDASYGARADYRLFVDVERLTGLGSELLDERGRAAIELFGLDAIHSLVLAGHTDGAVFVDRVAVLTDGPNPLASRLFAKGKATRETLALVPDVVENFTHVRLDAVALLDLVKRAAAIADDDAGATLADALRHADKSLGMPLEKLLGAFEPSWLLMTLLDDTDDAASEDPTEMLRNQAFRNAVLVATMRSPKLVEQVLTHLAGTEPSIVAKQAGGRPAFAIRAAHDATFDPLVVLDGNLLIAAVDRRLVFRYLERREQSIVRNPSFEFRWRAMPDGVAMLGFADPRPVVARLLPLAQSAATMFGSQLSDDSGAAFAVPDLPDASVLTRHLSPVTSHFEVREDGLFLESRSPFGTATVLLPIAGVAAAVALPKLFADAAPTTTATDTDATPTPAPTPRAAPRATAPATGTTRVSVSNEEASTLYALRSLVTAQAQFRHNTHIDRDSDGTGEFGTFAELAGLVPLPGSNERLSPPILTAAFSRIADGIVTRRGYHLRLFLPGADGKPVPEKGTGGADTGVDPKAAATAWAVVAWPTESSRARRSFYVDHRGRVYVTDTRFRGDRAPALEALLATEGDLRSGIVPDGAARDGSRWVEAR